MLQASRKYLDRFLVLIELPLDDAPETKNLRLKYSLTDALRSLALPYKKMADIFNILKIINDPLKAT